MELRYESPWGKAWSTFDALAGRRHGTVASGRAVTWTPLVVAAETLEWSAARAILREAEPTILIAVRRPGDDSPAVGAPLRGHGKPTKRQAREVGLRYLLKKNG